jgi:thioredoxin 1
MIKFFFYICFIFSSLKEYSSFPINGRRSYVPKFKMAVEEISSTAALDQILASSGNSLIVVDYSTTWCGPCKIALPKFIELSEKYVDVKFLKCIGDTSAEASQLMKREGVRSVPSFHFWKAGAKFETVNGAKIEEVEAVIKSNL